MKHSEGRLSLRGKKDATNRAIIADSGRDVSRSC